eukprot:s4213_g5.t2
MTLGNYDRSKATQRWSQLSSEASQIAAQVKVLTSGANSEVNSLASWSIVSGSGRHTENLEVGSGASFSSVGSQTSCLSGHGGPHCFLPSHLFNALQFGDEFPAASLVLAQDLQEGAKILSADGATIEVVKVERQKATKLMELEIDHAAPFTTTPNHRVIVPGGTAVKAIDLKVGSLVMCSDCMPKKVRGKKEFIVEEQEVLAITFNPDKAVACFLAQDQPVVLSMGLTSKPLRRARMNRRAWPQMDAEVASLPDTAAGEYED